ncbi:transcription factor grauzone-like [Wyeomyia smithii]|uniref:transcription factor grauzone-like n=1 Tax=Wyeomyia smithii TaxID=174621 RepID=UPI002468085C|nr:transcription factor grauzone-like [Wyeomyia smithii]
MECICRLCAEKIAKEMYSIEDPDLKMKMDYVLRFPVDLKQGYSSSVCQSCSDIICKFYQFAEKVRLNQEKNIIERRLSIEQVKVESLEKFPTDLATSVDLKTIKLESVFDDQQDSGNGEDIFIEFHDDDNQQNETNKSGSYEPQEQMGKPEAKKNNIKSKEKRKREDELLQDFYKFVCEICDETVSDFTQLRHHFRKSHNLSGYVRCCKRKYFKRCYLLEHIEKHINPEASQCEICKKNYADKECLQIHKIQAHGNIEDRPFKCELCKSSFSRRSMLNNHLSTHEKAQCPQCDRILASKSSLSVHLLNVHSGKRHTKICDSCGKEFLSKGAYEHHLKKHQGIDTTEKKVQCKICHKWLAGKVIYKRHMRYIHNEKGQSFICDVCKQVYPNSRALAIHKNSVHVDATFDCTICDKKFKRSRSLKEHMANHTGEMLYNCAVCGVGMNNNGNLYTHMKKCHPNEWLSRKTKTNKN